MPFGLDNAPSSFKWIMNKEKNVNSTSILQHFCDVLVFLKQEIRLHANTIISTSSFISQSLQYLFVILSVHSFVFSLVFYISSALDMDCRVAGINLFYLGTLEGQHSLPFTLFMMVLYAATNR